MSDEKVQNSMPFDRFKVQQICAEVDAELEAKKAKSASPSWAPPFVPYFENDPSMPVTEDSVAAPFEEVMPTEIADARGFKIGDVLTITSRSHPSCGRQARILQINSGVLPLYCEVLDYVGSHPFNCSADDKDLIRDCVIYKTNLCVDDFAASVTKTSEKVEPKPSSAGENLLAIEARIPLIGERTWHPENVVFYLSIFAGILAGIVCGFQRQDFIFGNNPSYGLIILRAVHFPIVGAMAGILPGVVLGGITVILDSLFPSLMTTVTNPIANTALGLWTAVRGIAYGIGYVGVCLYYSVGNQLFLSRMVGNVVFVEENVCSIHDAPVPVFPVLLHVGGVIASIAVVCETDGFPIWDKLIFGWWGFYALNALYLIGTKVSEKREKQKKIHSNLEY